MAQYLEVVNITAAGTADIGIPTSGAVLGISSTSPVTLQWVFNGTVGDILPAAVQAWEPMVPFNPAPTSLLRITATAAATVSIRMDGNA